MPSAITSALTASGTAGTAFSYQITASNNPTSFGASPLRQEIGLGGEREKVESEYGQLSGERDVSRVTLQFGKYSVKDIFDVFDWPTAAGSKLWANSVARQDATVIRRLREAGAVLVGSYMTPQGTGWMLAGCPNRCTGSKALVRGVMALPT